MLPRGMCCWRMCCFSRVRASPSRLVDTSPKITMVTVNWGCRTESKVQHHDLLLAAVLLVSFTLWTRHSPLTHHNHPLLSTPPICLSSSCSHPFSAPWGMILLNSHLVHLQFYLTLFLSAYSYSTDVVIVSQARFSMLHVHISLPLSRLYFPVHT